MMNGPRNKLKARDKVIAALVLLLLGNMFITWRLSESISSLPEEWTVDVPPDISMGITRGLTERSKEQVHGYAAMVQSTLNNWNEMEDRFRYSSTSEKDIGKLEPIRSVTDFRCLVTYEYYNQLKKERETYVRTGGYWGQERISRLIVGKDFSDLNTFKVGNYWVVDLPVEQKEYWRGKPLYKKNLSVQLKVVEGSSTAINCPKTRWNFLVAGLVQPPREIIVPTEGR